MSVPHPKSTRNGKWALLSKREEEEEIYVSPYMRGRKKENSASLAKEAAADVEAIWQRDAARVEEERRKTRCFLLRPILRSTARTVQARS